MTSEVIDAPTSTTYPSVMDTTKSAPSNLVPWIARAVLLLFGSWSVMIVLEHGYTGFIPAALAHDWTTQILVDLVIALVLATGWLINDATRRGIPAWPFIAMTVFLGSIGPLVYLSVRPQLDRGPQSR